MEQTAERTFRRGQLTTILLFIIAMDILLYYLWHNGHINFNAFPGICCLSVVIIINACFIGLIIMIILMVSYALMLYRRIFGSLFRREQP